MSKINAKAQDAFTSDYSSHVRVISSPKPFAPPPKVTIAFVTSDPVSLSGDVNALPEPLRDALRLLAQDAQASKLLTKAGDAHSTLLAIGKNTHRVTLISLGNAAKLTTEELRRAGAAAYRHTRSVKATDAALLPPSLDLLPPASVAEALTTGAILASFEFRHYVGSRREKDVRERKDVTLHLPANPDLETGRRRGEILALSCNLARTLSSRPGNDINPVTLASFAQRIAKSVGLKSRVIDEKEMARLKMGGLLAVGGGSATPPRLIVLEHRGGKPSEPPLLVVGKSITFDTGGISIKPAEKMWKMIYDKSGGCTVLGLMHALAQLNVRANVIGLLTSAENHVSDRAYRPGDIIRQYNGLTAEITSTDAEGRLVLADAIAWGIDTYKPAAVVDIATLTGGVVVALGNAYAGLFSNNDTLAAELTASGMQHHEKLWRLPMGDEYRDMLKSDLADVINAGGRWGSPCTAAAYLSLALSSENPPAWAHLDVAGTADIEKDQSYISRGSTAFGLRTIVSWIEHRSESQL